MRTSHGIFNVSKDHNRCLYNSISVMLYDSEDHSSFLKLESFLKGVLHMERIIQEVGCNLIIKWTMCKSSPSQLVMRPVEAWKGCSLCSCIYICNCFIFLSFCNKFSFQSTFLIFYFWQKTELHCTHQWSVCTHAKCV